jgi:hypothetical protein
LSKLTTVAWIAHNLGLAASFGGILFGKVALNGKLDVLDSESDRGKLLNAAWNRYNAINVLSLGTAAATWFIGRAGISGRSIDEEARGLVLTKDVLFILSAVSGLASIIQGRSLTRQAPEGAVPIASGTTPAPETSDEASRLLRSVNVLGNVNLVLIGAIETITTILAMKANKSTRWSAVSRFLP